VLTAVSKLGSRNDCVPRGSGGEHFDSTERDACSGQPAITGNQHTAERLCNGDVTRVVGSHVRSQLVCATHQRTCRISSQRQCEQVVDGLSKALAGQCARNPSLSKRRQRSTLSILIKIPDCGVESDSSAATAADASQHLSHCGCTGKPYQLGRKVLLQ
jgi:hypothetical protein